MTLFMEFLLAHVIDYCNTITKIDCHDFIAMHKIQKVTQKMLCHENESISLVANL